MTNTRKFHAKLLGTTCAMALGMAGGVAQAQVTSVIGASYLEDINQTFNGFEGDTATISAITGVGVTVPGSDGIGVVVDGIVDRSSLEIIGNEQLSSIGGNLAITVLNSNVLADTNGSASAILAGTFLDGRPRPEARSTGADLAVVTAQTVNNVEAIATTLGTVGTFSDDVIQSTVSIMDNVQTAAGTLNDSSATINSTANSSNFSTGVATSQVVTASSLDVTVTALADIEVQGVSPDGAGEVDEATLRLTGNRQVAQAIGNRGVNTINAEMNALSIIVDDGTTDINLGTPGPSAAASAGNAIASSQLLVLGQGDQITATVDGLGAGFLVSVEDDVDPSTVTNSDNLARALLRGNEVNNTLSLSGNSIVTVDDEEEPVQDAAGAVTSLQIFDATATATAMGAAGEAVRTLIGEDVYDSTVTTSANRIEAIATGNIGANRVLVTNVNTVDTSGNGGPGATANAVGGLAGLVRTTGAGFELSSAQVADGSITATLRFDDGEDTTAASILTRIGGDIDDSTVRSDGNTLRAAATANEITPDTNLISITGNNVTTTTALANFQATTADVSAEIGAAGTPGGIQQVEIAPAIPEFTENFAEVTVGAGDVATVDVSGFADEVNEQFASQLNAVAPGGVTVTYDPDTQQIVFTNTTGVGIIFPATSVLVPEVPAQFAPQFIPGTLGAGGVIISALGTIDDSVLSVDRNTTLGTVTGNIASNRIVVDVNNLEGASALVTSTAAADPDGVINTIGIATAEQALANTQTILGSNLDTDVAGTFAINVDLNEYATTDSTLSVSGNEQAAVTRGNVVFNSIALSATNMDTGAAISSLQLGGLPDEEVAVSASSEMDVSAPAAMLRSTLSLDSNINEAVAVVNTASNTMTVSPGNVESISNGANVALLSSTTTAGTVNTATADFVIANGQVASGTVDANAVSRVVNQDQPFFVDPSDPDVPGTLATVGILDSTATVNGNVTLAQAEANRSTNRLTLNGGAGFEATGAVLNVQGSDAAVTANVDATAGIRLLGNTGGAGEPVVEASSVSVSGNAASAQARGNVATNVLNGTSRSFDAVSTAGASAGLDTGNNPDTGVSASFGVLNNQVNAGPITANVTAQFGMQLNSTGGTGGTAVLNSTGSVMGNLVQASAAANTATNTLTLSALDHGFSSAGLGNEQINTGNVIASVSASRIGGTTLGGVTGSTLSVGGNVMSASAVGNSAISTLTRD